VYAEKGLEMTDLGIQDDPELESGAARACSDLSDQKARDISSPVPRLLVTHHTDETNS
jgi:hypothetical protein